MKKKKKKVIIATKDAPIEKFWADADIQNYNVADTNVFFFFVVVAFVVVLFFNGKLDLKKRRVL